VTRAPESRVPTMQLKCHGIIRFKTMRHSTRATELPIYS
jgi:hypothetical protein